MNNSCGYYFDRTMSLFSRFWPLTSIMPEDSLCNWSVY